ncbi:hypothetical protein C9374_012586 [Naegleria lovaniensis]|uniref:Cytochrome P450 n=1 Tax=Naegleria lovaniensis TaxID=51637 RepID=A0AA88KR35_NAELO|nr:uncharacterized protein C9374_012586 [Naegleria lovaniensis]KAG2392334.1 hypothetical protein C9374_012586 [Naegleria lovaniensis]
MAELTLLTATQSVSYWSIGFAILIVLFTIMYFRLMPKKPSKSPPMIGRYIPFIGVAKRFGTEPIKLLEECKEKHGEIFTLNIAGKCFTFLTDPELFQYFFNPAKGNSCRVKTKKTVHEESKHAISFDHAVLEFISRVFGIPVNDFMSQHITMVNTMRAKLSPNTTLPFYTKEIASNLLDVFEKGTSSWSDQASLSHPSSVRGFTWNENGTNDLFKGIVETLFWSTVKSLYEKDAFLTDEFDACKAFQILDEQFEIRASGMVPESFMSTFSKAKQFLLRNISDIASKLDATKPEDQKRMFQSLSDALKDNVEDQKTILHFGLAMLWASQANSLPSSLWTICFVVSNPEIYSKLQQEVDDVFTNHIKNPRDLSFENLHLFPYVKACVYEAIRIIPPGMLIRKVMQPIKIPNYDYIIPEGHNLCISPFIAHFDEKYYHDPHTFNPERWLQSGEDSLSDRSKQFIAWGRGPHECPGKAFSVVELISFIALFFYKFRNIKLNGPMPSPALHRLIGVPHPSTTVSISYEKRQQ